MRSLQTLIIERANAMTKEHQEEIDERLQEINRLLEYYNPYEKYIRIAILIAGAIGFIVLALTITYWALLIYLVIVLGVGAINQGKKTDPSLTESQIKKAVFDHVRIIMAIIREDEHPELPKQRVYTNTISSIETSYFRLCGCDSLYGAFVKRFPNMDTPKLRSFLKPKKNYF